MDSNKRAAVDRRDFLKLAGVGLVGANSARLLLQPSGQALASAPNEDDVAILYDVSKCIGCRICEEACKEYNNLPVETVPPSDLSAIKWNLIRQRQGGDAADWPFFNYQCMHCTDAACVMVCPTGALHKDAEGFVAFDQDKCNGCGYCTQFCPFGVPHLGDVNLITGQAKAAKCTFCQQKVRAGIGGPSCAEACPTGALTWGRRGALLEEAKARVTDLKAEGHSEARLYGESEAGGLHRLSILLDAPAAYGLPVDPQGPISFSFIWQRIIQPLGEVAVGATALGLVINWLIARTQIKVEEA
jgi:formate dehydrogenase iron-sulfur subunit